MSDKELLRDIQLEENVLPAGQFWQAAASGIHDSIAGSAGKTGTKKPRKETQEMTRHGGRTNACSQILRHRAFLLEHLLELGYSSAVLRSNFFCNFCELHFVIVRRSFAPLPQ
jgi:hypothetical protein